MNAAERGSKKKFISVFILYLSICALLALILILFIYSSIFRTQKNEAILRTENTLSQIKLILENYYDVENLSEDLTTSNLANMGLNDLSSSGYLLELVAVDDNGDKKVDISTLAENSDVESMSDRFFDMDWTLSVCPKNGWVGLKEIHKYILTAVILVFLISYLLAKNTLAEQEKEIAFLEAKEANAAKTAFLNNISHDIRTPMNAIVGMVQIAIKNIDDKVRVLECLSKVELSSDHLLSLINSVLDMNKLETDRFEFPENPFDMDMLIRDCITVVEPLSLGSSVTIHSHIAAIKEFRYLIGSQIHVKQIIINILTNAVKYNKPGGSVDIYCDNKALDNDMCEYIFVFKDNGIGMSEEFLRKIFTPFSQEDSTARTNYTGSGLGLSIVKMMVERMGGTIVVESTKEVGSTFTVTLPFKVDKEHSASMQPEKMFMSTDISGYNILLVEDNTLNMEIALYVLEEAGADVQCAMNGEEAVRIYETTDEKYPFDVILMDVMMSGMDGYEATKAIRNSNKKDAKTVPIIALTANAFKEDIIKCREAGMNGHLAKPVNVNEMLKTISEMRGVKWEETQHTTIL